MVHLLTADSNTDVNASSFIIKASKIWMNNIFIELLTMMETQTKLHTVSLIRHIGRFIKYQRGWKNDKAGMTQNVKPLMHFNSFWLNNLGYGRSRPPSALLLLCCCSLRLWKINNKYFI